MNFAVRSACTPAERAAGTVSRRPLLRLFTGLFSCLSLLLLLPSGTALSAPPEATPAGRALAGGDAASLGEMLEKNYSGLLSELSSRLGNEDAAKARLTVAYRLFTKGLRQLEGVSSSGRRRGRDAGGGDRATVRRRRPSDRALSSIERLLPDVPGGASMDLGTYLSQFEGLAGRLDETAYKEIMLRIAEDVLSHQGNAADPALEGARRLVSEDKDTRRKVSRRVAPSGIEVPDSLPPSIDSDSSVPDNPLLPGLAGGAGRPMDKATIAALGDAQLAELLRIAGSASPSSHLGKSLALLRSEKQRRARLAATAGHARTGSGGGRPSPGRNGPPGEAIRPADGDGGLADARAAELDRMGGSGGKPLWFDACLRNLTDFFHAGKDEDDEEDKNDEDEGRYAYDPLTGEKVDPSELDFDAELVQRDKNETISRRGLDQR